jgi:hypothetical protein
MLGFEAALITQAAREFETDERAHAMTEERERLVEVWRNLKRELLDQFIEPRVTRFSYSGFSSRQQSRNELDWVQKFAAPVAENRATAARIWKTK